MTNKAQDIELNPQDLFELAIRHCNEAGELKSITAYIKALHNDAKYDAYDPTTVANPPLQQNAIGQMLAYDNLLEIIDNVIS